MPPTVLALVGAHGRHLGDRHHVDLRPVHIHHVGHDGRNVLIALLVPGAAHEVEVELQARKLVPAPAQALVGAHSHALLAAGVLKGLLVARLSGDGPLFPVPVHTHPVRGPEQVADELSRLGPLGADQGRQRNLR